jgi:hypothetical protein
VTNKHFEKLMVFIKGCINHVSFESGSNDVDECHELLAGIEDLLDIVTALENVKFVSSSQTAVKKKEDRARV